jgi:hypothetical protein
LIICGISAPVQRLVPGAIEVGILHEGFSPEALEGIEEDSVGEHACIAVVYKLVVVCLQTKIP